MMVLPLFWLLIKYSQFTSIVPLFKRLRWLFLSLFILNLWFSSPIFTWQPEINNLLLAIERVAALILVVLAAHLLITTTTTQTIVAALLWWLMPLNKIGLTTERLAVRIALVLDTVQVVQNTYIESSFPTNQNPLNQISERVANLFNQVLTYAEQVPLQTLEISKLQSPPLWQWSYPLFLLLLITCFELL